MDTVCGYCYGSIGNEDFLECEECEQYVHVRCLRRPGTPGDFYGDVFFEFTCSQCTKDQKEIFERQKMPWSLLIILAIYNLSRQSQGLSHHGFFHWRTHIAHFIDKNWSLLVDPNTKRRKNWIGTISGSLSHNSPAIFTSGFSLFNEAGWWKLTHSLTPKQYCEYLKKIRQDKSATITANENPLAPTVKSEPEEQNDIIVDGDIKEEANECEEDDCMPNGEKEVFSRTMPYMGCTPRVHSKPESEIDILDFIEPINGTDFLGEMPILSSSDVNSVIPTFNEDIGNDLFIGNFHDLDYDMSFLSDISSEASKYEPKIVQFTNFQEDEMTETTPALNIKQEVPSDDEHEVEDEIPYEEKYVCEKSLFTRRDENRPRSPWRQDLMKDFVDTSSDDFAGDKNIEMMSEYEEMEMYKRLKAVINSPYSKHIEIPSWVRRYYRKLSVRKLHRSFGKGVFDLDNYLKYKIDRVKPEPIESRVLDRFHHLLAAGETKRENVSFHARLAGSTEHTLFMSPFTNQVLQPFIYRNDTCIPQWIRLMCELQYEVNGEVVTRASVDFCYVRPHHIAAVNALLQRLFWPGIDMSECLSYPDYTVVALYKKLVVGCAFLVPDVGHNEAYISFMAVRPGWQRAGIASFMLYHLTQTCLGKDLTLHVSANNPAICLYQKFGFKIEKLILDFYEKFLPADSSHSKHAFLLRLER